MTTLAELRAIAEAATPIYDGLYAVDREGRVFSFTRWRGHDVRQLVPTDDGDGYLRVRLTIRGKRFNAGVHRLVCQAFHGPKPTPSHEVRHLNGSRRDNRAENLAWGTRVDNAADRDAHGTTASGERNGNAVLTVGQVAAIRETYGGRAANQYQIAAAYRVSQRTISRIVRGEQWT